MQCTYRKLHQSIYNILPSHFTYFPTLTYYFFLKLHIVINQTHIQLNGFTSKQSSHSQRKIWSFMLDYILSLSYIKYIFMYFLINKTQNSITKLELGKQLAMTRIHYLHSLLHHPLCLPFHCCLCCRLPWTRSILANNSREWSQQSPFLPKLRME